MIEALTRRKVADTVTPATEGDGVVRVTLASLLALHRAGDSLTRQPQQVRALSGGNYLSPFKGRGMEFDEVRPYMQGDDVRTIDWRVTARSGRPHTKLFREERERPVLLAVDLRAAMFFATRGAFKAVRAAQSAALLGWSALKQGDRLGALLFDEQQTQELRPRHGQPPFLHLLRQLAAHPAWNNHTHHSDPGAAEQSLNEALLRLRRVTQPGSKLILCSDLHALSRQGEAHLAQLARHNELLLLAIHDPLEAELPPPGRYRFSDGSKFLALESGDNGLRERYRQQFALRQAQLQQLCRRHHISHLSLSTADEPSTALQYLLGGRR